VVLKLIAIKAGNWVPGIDRNRYFIDSIDTLRFWHRYLSIPEIRYYCQACFGPPSPSLLQDHPTSYRPFSCVDIITMLFNGTMNPFNIRSTHLPLRNRRILRQSLRRNPRIRPILQLLHQSLLRQTLLRSYGVQ
jgi:hypothetical protein